MLAQTQMRILPVTEVSPTTDRRLPETEASELVALLQLAQRGDVEAFGRVLEEFQDRIFRFVLRTLGNTHDAEDVTQDTFVKAWRHLGSFRTANNFSAWLFTIARRTALNHIRARRPGEELTGCEEASQAAPDDLAQDSERADSVWAMARRLKPDQYEVLWLRYGEGFSVEETARIMNTNSIRVRVLLHRARKRMAEWLQHRKPETGGPR